MNATHQNGRRDIVLFVVVGFFVGAAISSIGIWPEFFARLRWALSGGGGESSEWGEPLFYMAIYGIPTGLIGAAIGLAIAFAVRRFCKPKA